MAGLEITAGVVVAVVAVVLGLVGMGYRVAVRWTRTAARAETIARGLADGARRRRRADEVRAEGHPDRDDLLEGPY